LGHATLGFETTLSSRVRHNQFLNQFKEQFSLVRSSGAINKHYHQSTLTDYENVIEIAVDKWLSKYMHTKSFEHEFGVFSIFPDNEEAATFIADLNRNKLSVENLMVKAAEGMKKRLSIGLTMIRNNLLPELLKDIDKFVDDLTDEKQSIESDSAAKVEIKKIADFMKTASKRACEELKKWFVIHDETLSYNPTAGHLLKLVEQHYQNQVRANKLKIYVRNIDVDMPLTFSNHQIRQMFYLLIELVHNVIEYSEKFKNTIWITGYRDSQFEGVVVSNKCAHTDNVYSEKVASPSATKDLEALYTEGHTGLKKIAAQCQQLTQTECLLFVQRKRNSFRVTVPLVKTVKHDI